MRANSQTRFRPELDTLEVRALLSTITATVSRKVLTITRDDATMPIQVDVQTLSVKSRGKPKPAPGGGTVLVHGVGSFAAKKIKVIVINPGYSTANIIVNEPPKKVIPFRINATTGTPPPVVVTPPPTSTSPSVPGVTGTQSALEQQIFDLINAERIKAGVAPLTLNSKLVTAAQIHARDMAALDIMDHDLPGVAQPTLTSRAQFVGYKYTWLGENIASFYTDAASVVAGWMASPGHRANILNPNLTEAGIGVGMDASGVLFFCQEFGSPA